MKYYGQYPVTKIIKSIDALRKAIRSEGTPAIQEAWDRIEPVIDFFLRRPTPDDEHKG